MSKPSHRLAKVTSEFPWAYYKRKTQKQLKRAFTHKERRALNDATKDGTL